MEINISTRDKTIFLNLKKMELETEIEQIKKDNFMLIHKLEENNKKIEKAKLFIKIINNELESPTIIEE